MSSDYEMTIGIECHVQLATATKLFSPANNDSRQAQPNSCVHPVDWALPGMLPVLNRRAVDLAILAGKALSSQIASVSRFDRKHYFYPDLPKGYQTSQLYQPIILAGSVTVPMEDGSEFKVRIHHAHLEEDAGKLTHSAGYSLVDLNRAGTPLIEIVTEPDIHSAAEARAFASELHKLMVFARVTDGDLYHGNMRFDVNLSVAKKGATELGKRTEVKNLNSFRSIERAAEYEFKRQVDLLESGQAVVQETRGWDDDRQITTSQRSKEDAQDYRYMPDPDIPPIVLSQQEIETIQSKLPTLPSQYRQSWASIGLDWSVVNSLLASREYAAIVLQAQQRAGDQLARHIAHWLVGAIASTDQSTGGDQQLASVEDLIELSSMVEASEVSSSNAKELFNMLLEGQTGPHRLAEEKQMLQLSDTSVVTAIVDQVLADPASQASIGDFRAGKDKAIGYLVGQVMKQSKGQANPEIAQRLIRERLGDEAI